MKKNIVKITAEQIVKMTVEQFCALRQRVIDNTAVLEVPVDYFHNLMWMLRASKCPCEYVHVSDGVCIIFKHV